MSADVEQLKGLLLWAREQRIVLSEIRLSDLVVIVERDHGMKLPDKPMPQAEPKRGIFEQYAGRLLTDDGPSDKNEPTIEDDE